MVCVGEDGAPVQGWLAWQGQELSRGALVEVMQQVLQPIGEVQGNLAVYSEAFDNRGVQANEDEEVLGHGGGMYVPTPMEDLGVGITNEQKAKMLELWDRVGWSQRGQMSWGQAVVACFGTAQQGTSLLGCQCWWQTGGRWWLLLLAEVRKKQ